MKITNPYDRMTDILCKYLSSNTIHEQPSMKEIENNLSLIPKRFSKFGDMIVFNEALEKLLKSDIYINLTNEMKYGFWEIVSKSLGATKVVVVFNIFHDSAVREPRTTLLHGPSSVASYLENHILFTWDVKKVMFSRGNISEKLRLSRLNCSEEVVVDMFAGIGYFSLTYMVHCRAKFLYACEWNKDAVQWLKYNLEKNNVKREKYSVLEGDCRLVAPKRVAQRVNLGLIPSCRDYWRTACEALSPITGGVLHIHQNVTSKDVPPELPNECILSCNVQLVPHWTYFALFAQASISSILYDIYGSQWNVSISHLQHVKSYAPHIDHMVLDLECRP